MSELSVSSNSISNLGSNAVDSKSERKDDCLIMSAAAVKVSGELSVSDVSECLPDLPKGKFLRSIYYVLDNGLVFTDKLLPDPSKPLACSNLRFQSNYYTDLHLRCPVLILIIIWAPVFLWNTLD